MQIFLLLHPDKKLFMGRIILLAGLLFSGFNGLSQDFDAATWRYIDTCIDKKKNLSDAHNLVQQLKQKAFTKKKYFHAARCYYYQVLIADQRMEDSFYFRNSAVIDSLLKVSADKPELQLAMQLLQAKRLSSFTTRYLRFNRQRYERKGIPVNYAAYTNTELDSLAQLHFDQAKQIATNMPATSPDDALWLSSDPLLFLFKPGLFDIAIAEQIRSLNKNRYNPVLTSIRQAKSLTLSQDEFIAEMDALYTGNKSYLLPLKYYKEWLNHQKQNPSAYYFIETLARKFLYEILSVRNNTEKPTQKDYENYLVSIASSPYNTVKAHAVYQLCLLWNQQSKKYFPSGGYDYDYKTGSFAYQKEYDTSYRYHAAKALRLFEQHKAMLDSFAYLKNILLRMEEAILENDISITMEHYNLPGEPILAELTFKNAEKIFYSIVRMNNDFSYSKYKREVEVINKLKQLPEVSKGTMDLPSTNDFNKHAAYLKLDALTPGNYALLFSRLPLNDTGKAIEHLYFKVSSIAILEKNKRVFVLDRKTGFPLAGAKAKGSHWHDPKDTLGLKQPVTRNYTVNEQGFIEIRDKKIVELEVYYKNDTAYSGISGNDEEEDEPEDVYDKEEYDDLVEYYEDNATVEVFTDRSIYRPGQTVHFKAVFMTTNSKTGEPMVMSKENLKGKLFGNIYKKWLKESEPQMYLTDPFDREIDTIKIKLNEYGSISGSFRIPKTAATGKWSIEPDYLDYGRNEGFFRVEEYKRPSYEISIENPKKELLPGDSFTVRVKVKSFAGAALNNVLINYSVDRNGQLPFYDTLLGKMSESYKTEYLVDTSGYTNAEGELEILVYDTLLKKYLLGNEKEWNFNYSIKAEAIDITGENYETNSSVRISSRPVSIRLSMADKYKRDEKNSAVITANDQNAGKVLKDIKVKVYRVIKEEKLYTDRKLTAADQWVYTKEQLQQWFPLINFSNTEDTGTRKLLFEKMVNTGKDQKVDIDPVLFTAGNYVMEATCEENGRLKGFTKKPFSVYDEKENKLPQRAWSFYRLPFNSFFPGDTIKYENGNSESPVYSIFYLKYFSGKKKTNVTYYYEIIKQEKGISRWEWKVPQNATDQVLLTQVYILNNQLYNHTETIYINDNTAAEPEIIIEQYRQKLSPGSKETFSVSVKTKNENTVAELMTTLYDASLEKLEKHKWEIPRQERRRYLRDHSNTYINSNVTSNNFTYYQDYYRQTTLIRPAHTNALWWVNPLNSAYDDGPAYEFSSTPARRMLFAPSFSTGSERARRNGGFDFDMNPTGYLEGRFAGLSLANTEGLNEVVVTVGYSTSRKKDITGSVVTIRGNASLSSYSQPLIILDGVPFEGDLSKLDPNTITQGIVLKGADASSIYGARASNGVLVLSTKGPIVFPELPPEPPLPPRKNFNETAFFFPAIYADKEGYYKFTFTMPESVTEWNWKIMAHTKQLQFAYKERKLNTQLPLMVQPNMPRLLYQGDRIILQSRISNLDSINASGKAICKIEDVVTGEDITSLFASKTQNDFSVSKKANISSAFEIKVPKTQLNPIKIIVSARSQNFADGEEHIIPVLSPKVLVKESLAFRFSKNTDTTLQAINLPADAELYGMGFSIMPKPQAALINALPYLANYSFDCAEQTFNKLRALVTAFKMMRTDPEAQRSFEKAKQVMEKLPEQKEQLPEELSEQSMPWLNLANKAMKQQKQLFEILDTSRTFPQIKKHWDKLYKLQNSDGGLTWFDGGKSDPYISNYILAGFGKLRKDSLLIPPRVFEEKQTGFIMQLLSYCNKQFQNDLKEVFGLTDPLFYAYARSYWTNVYPVTDSSLKNIRDVLDERWKKAADYSLYNQAVLIITTLRYFDKGTDGYNKAVKQLSSIEQLAIKDDINGIRWKDLADADDMSNSSEETLALLAEAFSEAGAQQDIFPGIVKWLLTAKSESHWSSTKATSAVIGILSKEKQTATGVTQTISGTVNTKKFLVTDDLISGNNFSFINESKAALVELKKESNVPASGNVMWYYFSAGDNVSKANKEVNLKKELFRYNDSEAKWGPINEKTSLKIADKIKVVLTIETSKALRYVYIDDKRAAAFEPKENNSGYRYEQGMSYYLSVRDAGIQFFSAFIPSGRSAISYEMTVAQEGNFSNGPASLQCMYKPEVNAYSNGSTVQTVK